MIPPLDQIIWNPCWRLVSSRFPPQGLFDRVANPDDLELVFAIESLTNDRLREEVGALSFVPDGDRISGPGTTPIMAAFTHLNPRGSRFTDGSYGVYYAASNINTAIVETQFHRARFLAATNEPPLEIDMRSYTSNVDAELHNIRGQQEIIPEIYDSNPEHYSSARELAKRLRDKGSNGIVYSSVRDQNGECIAVFRPSILEPVVQGAHYCYVWNGSMITDVYIKSEYRP